MRAIILAVLTILVSGVARADDFTGRTGLGMTGGLNAEAGPRSHNPGSAPDYTWGFWGKTGVSEHLMAGFSYDQFFFKRTDVRMQPMLVSAFYQFAPKAALNPDLHLGAGLAFVDPMDTSHRSAFAANAGLGINLFDGKLFSFGMGADYYLIKKNAAMKHEFQVFVASIKMGFWFGGNKYAAKESAYEAPLPPAVPVTVAAEPAPVVVPVAPLAAVDTDGDGIADNMDNCPGTSSGVAVDATGCQVAVNKGTGAGRIVKTVLPFLLLFAL